MISIIMPVYNTEKYLDRSITSIVNQTYGQFELIIVDDGSTDHSLEIIKNWVKKDNRIKYLQKPNGGVSSARNKGLEKASFDYIMFVDSDDWIEPNMVDKLLNNISLEYDAAFGNMFYAHESGEKKEKKLSFQGVRPLHSGIVASFLNRSLGYGSGVWGAVFRKTIIEKNGEALRFDENLSIGEDQIWLIQYLIRCQSVILDSECYYNYFLRSGSAMRSDDKINESEIACKKKLLTIINQYDRTLDRYVLDQLFLALFDVTIKAVRAGRSDIVKKYSSELKNTITYFLAANHSFLFKMRHLCCLLLIFMNAPAGWIVKIHDLERGI